jgi:A/G-specific adenine glycosylase
MSWKQRDTTALKTGVTKDLCGDGDALRSSHGEPAMPLPSASVIRSFRETIYEHYRAHGREFPWRTTHDPYGIMVSEFMLQQTQVERVLCKFSDFLARFSDPVSLAVSPLRDVLAAWSGLGYNRRALSLQKTAQIIVNDFAGNVPDSPDTLRTFPGIGPSTAGAIAAFAFGKPTVFIETNIRRVLLHFFFAEHSHVRDRDLFPVAECVLDRHDPRSWHYA